MKVSLLKLKWNGAKWWQSGWIVSYAANRVKVVHHGGNVLLDCSVTFFKAEVGKGRAMYG